MKTSTHNGSCCGINHIHGFSIYYLSEGWTQERLDKANATQLAALETQLNQRKGWIGGGIMAEVVLTQNQKAVWHNALLNRGFTLVNSFFNGNSGNDLFVYHKAPPARGVGPYERFTQMEELSDTLVVVGDWVGERPDMNAPAAARAPLLQQAFDVVDL